jgi:hypothetical protein
MMSSEMISLIATATPGVAGLMILWSKIRLLEYQVNHLEAQIDTLEKRIDRHEKGIVQLTNWAQASHQKPFNARSKKSDGQLWPSDDPPWKG